MSSRCASITEANGADPILASFYELNWHLIPNLALDVWAYLTAPFMNVDWASRVFLILSFVLLSSGTIFVHRTLGGKGYWPYIGFVLI